MIKFSVLYPYKKGAWFDSKYYSKHHIAPYRNDPLVKGIIVESGDYSRDFQIRPNTCASLISSTIPWRTCI